MVREVGSDINFSQVDLPMKLMAELVCRGRKARELVAVLERVFAGVKRDAPCLCGSKFEQCHGRKTSCNKD